MWVTHVHFTFSGCHNPSDLYLTQCIKSIASLTYNQHKIINEIAYIPPLIECFGNPSVFYTQSTPLLGPATFQGLTGHMKFKHTVLHKGSMSFPSCIPFRKSHPESLLFPVSLKGSNFSPHNCPEAFSKPGFPTWSPIGLGDLLSTSTSGGNLCREGRGTRA